MPSSTLHDRRSPMIQIIWSGNLLRSLYLLELLPALLYFTLNLTSRLKRLQNLEKATYGRVRLHSSSAPRLWTRAFARRWVLQILSILSCPGQVICDRHMGPNSLPVELLPGGSVPQPAFSPPPEISFTGKRFQAASLSLGSVRVRNLRQRSTKRMRWMPRSRL